MTALVHSPLVGFLLLTLALGALALWAYARARTEMTDQDPALPFPEIGLGDPSQHPEDARAVSVARTIANLKAAIRRELAMPADPAAVPNPQLELLLLAWLEVAVEYHVAVIGIDATQDYVDEVLAGRNSEYAGLPSVATAMAR
jgi:hypothetical protein